MFLTLTSIACAPTFEAASESEPDPFPYHLTTEGCKYPQAVVDLVEDYPTIGDLTETAIPLLLTRIDECDADIRAIEQWGCSYHPPEAEAHECAGTSNTDAE